MRVGTEMGNELMEGFHISTIHDTTEYILMYNIGKEVKYITIYEDNVLSFESFVSKKVLLTEMLCCYLFIF